MKGIKKYISTVISLILLLAFSITVVPVELFHNQISEIDLCLNTETKQTCTHTSHISSENNYCWVCAIHFDKEFINSPINSFHLKSEIKGFYTTRHLSAHSIKSILATLRGPPNA